MRDVLQVFARFKDCAAALRSIHLVENSLNMRKLQENNLRQLMDRGWELRWYDAVDDLLDEKPALEDVHTIVIANEFFDALPTHIIEV